MRTIKNFCIILLFFLVSALSLTASEKERPDWKGEDMNIFLVTYGPGDQLWEQWGHITFYITNPKEQGERMYDFGNFDFNATNFYGNFLMGRLNYKADLKWESNSDRSRTPQYNLKFYEFFNRDIYIQKLDLTGEEKMNLFLRLEENVLPKNMIYRYHYYYDNCSSRLRDHLDASIGGQLKAATDNERNGLTYRQDTYRHLNRSPLINWFLNFLMGRTIDRQMSTWDDMYRPEAFRNQLNEFVYTDSDGNTKPIVSSSTPRYLAQGRPVIPAEVPPVWLFGVYTGLGLAAVYWLLHKLRQRSGKARIPLGLYQILLGFVMIILCYASLFFQIFTDHDVASWNENILMVHPLSVFLFIAGIQTLKKQGDPQKHEQRMWMISMIGYGLTLILKATGVFYQQNWITFWMFLPISVTGFLLACLQSIKSSPRWKILHHHRKTGSAK